MYKFAIIRRSYIWLIGWFCLSILAAVVFYLNFKLSIEFTWWVDMSINTTIDWDIVKSDLQEALIAEWYLQSLVTTNKQIDDSLSVIVNLGLTDDKQVKDASEKIQDILIEREIIESDEDLLWLSLIWPSIWANMKESTMWILILWILAIAVYMMFSFSSIRGFISPSKLAFVTIVTMMFDVIIPSWAYGLYMYFDPTIQVNTVFVTALLMIMGYSINDTIIILDRVRENVNLTKDGVAKWINYSQVFEDSIWQTMRRSMWTSISTFLVVFILFIFSYIYWAKLIQDFSFVLSVWVLVGTFSSIFIAAPLVYILIWKFNRETKGNNVITKKTAKKK